MTRTADGIPEDGPDTMPKGSRADEIRDIRRIADALDRIATALEARNEDVAMNAQIGQAVTRLMRSPVSAAEAKEPEVPKWLRTELNR